VRGLLSNQLATSRRAVFRYGIDASVRCWQCDGFGKCPFGIVSLLLMMMQVEWKTADCRHAMLHNTYDCVWSKKTRAPCGAHPDHVITGSAT